MSRVVTVVGIVGLCWAAAARAQAPSPDATRYPRTLEGQLARVSAELPCLFTDDTWKITNHRPPPRVPCPWTFQTFTITRALWTEAAANRARISLTALRQDAPRFAGEPYVVTGRVRSVRHDLLSQTHLWLTAADGQEIEVVGVDYMLPGQVGDVVDVVGYLAGWSEPGHEQIPVLAASDSLRGGEVARLVERWQKPAPPPPSPHGWLRR